MRQPRLIAVLGTNGVGKSTLLREITKNEKKRLIVTPSGLGGWDDIKPIDPRRFRAWRRGTRQAAFYYEREADLKEGEKLKRDLVQLIERNLKNACVIFDDCTSYVKPNISHCKGLNDLLINFRHRALDLYFVIHSPNKMPPSLWTYCTDVVVGFCNQLISKTKVDLYCYDEIHQTQLDINKQFKEAEARGDGSQYGLFKHFKIK